jgi:hypothetical protein
VADGFQQVELGSGEALDDARRRDTRSIAEEPQAVKIGWIADELSDFDERGEAITRGCIMTFTGRWITDSSHQHNEIHDIASAQLVECNDCQTDTTGSSTSGLIAAVGIGRHPTGRDP